MKKEEATVKLAKLEHLVAEEASDPLFRTLAEIKDADFEALAETQYFSLVNVFAFLHTKDRERLKQLIEFRHHGKLLFKETDVLLFDAAMYLEAVEYSFSFNPPDHFTLSQTPLGKNFPEGEIVLDDPLIIHFSELSDFLRTLDGLRKVANPMSMRFGQEKSLFFRDFRYRYQSYPVVQNFLHQAKRDYDRKW